MRHRFIALPLAVLASLALASVALAGGWAQVTVKEAPIDPPAGGETTINLNVLQHGVTPVSWPTLNVVATDATSGAVVRAEAQAQGPVGSYVATIVFPRAGDWTLTFDSAELEMEGSVAMSVAAPAVAAAGLAAAAPAASTFDAMPLLLLLVVVAAALAIAGLALRGRAASANTRVPVRN
jgi:hypothetical protein